MASIEYPNAPVQFRMLDFKKVSEDFGGLAKSAKFAVHIKPRGLMSGLYTFAQDLVYLCEAAEIPGRGFVNVDVGYYGPNQKLPVKSQYEDINMTFLCRNMSLEREFFDTWMTAINPVNTYDFFYRDEYSCEIDIYQYSDIGYSDEYEFLGGISPFSPRPGVRAKLEHVPEYCITLMDAYPLLVNPQPVTWQDDIFQRLVINFTYTKWIRKGLDPQSTTFGIVRNAQIIP